MVLITALDAIGAIIKGTEHCSNGTLLRLMAGELSSAIPSAIFPSHLSNASYFQVYPLSAPPHTLRPEFPTLFLRENCPPPSRLASLTGRTLISISTLATLLSVTTKTFLIPLYHPLNKSLFTFLSEIKIIEIILIVFSLSQLQLNN